MSLTLRWWFFHPFSDWSVKRTARKDALHEPPIPAAASTDHPPFIRRLKQAADGTIRNLGVQWKKQEGRLKTKWHRVNKQLNYWTDLLNKQDKEQQGARDRFRAHTHKDVEHLMRGRTILYLVVAFVVWVIEIPINMFVFQSLHESQVTTTIFALGIGAGLVVLAHILGIRAAERKFQGNPEWALGDMPVVLLAILLFASLTWARYYFIRNRSTGTESAELSVALVLVFLAVNLMLLLGMRALAIWSHLPGEWNLNSLKRKIAKMKVTIEKLEERAKVLKTQGEHLREDFLRRAEAVKDTAQQLHYFYYEHNLRNRSDIADYPASFRTRLDLDSTLEKAFPPMSWADGPNPGQGVSEGTDAQEKERAPQAPGNPPSKSVTRKAEPESPALGQEGGGI